MPVKRRIGKARHFDEYCREQLLEGPDAVLLAGVGYFAPFMANSFDQLEREEQEAMLEAMRTDWMRHGREMLERWRRGEREPGLSSSASVVPGGPDRLPWAAQAFGEP